MPPTSIFGTGLVGMSFDTPESVSSILELLKSTGTTHLDCAPLYPPLNQGLAERLLGEAGAVEKGFTVDSKVAAKPGGGELTVEGIDGSVRESMGKLGCRQVCSSNIVWHFLSCFS
jgi:aflatoxin B1 aldehyde reductase